MRLGVTRRLIGVFVLLAAACGGDGSPGTTPPPLVISSARSLPDGTAEADYEVTLVASGGSGAVLWSLSAGSLPSGLALGTDGRVAGRPTAAETRAFSVRASSGGQQATADFTLTVAPAPLRVTNTALPDATLGTSYWQFLNAEGGAGTTVWTVSSGLLPTGLALSTSGIIAGTPTTLGPAPFTVRATRGPLVAERALSILVVPPPLTIETTSLPAAKSGEPYFVTLESRGGAGATRWSVSTGTLPSGLTLAPDGTLSGTPSIDGTFTVGIAAESGTQRTTVTLVLVVEPAGYPSAVLVTMPTNAFVPFLVQIARGGTVTWRFGAEPHNAIFVPTPGAPADINIVSNVDVSRTFPTVGSFRYDCTIHVGMRGVIEVKP